MTGWGGIVVEDGRVLRPAGLGLPRPNGKWGKRAVARLTELAMSDSLSVARSRPEDAPSRPDRHGRTAVPLRLADGRNLAAALIGEGLGWVAAEAGAEPLFASENLARERRRGIWSDGTVPILPAPAAARAVGRFALIYGEVLRATDTRNGVYLDFGADWRRDFSILVPRGRLRAFRAAGKDPQTLVGAKVEVRGYPVRHSGVLVTVLHPQALRLIQPP